MNREKLVKEIAESTNYINSKIQFYIPEMVIFVIYFTIYCCASIVNHGFLLGGLLFGGVSFIFFILEHRTDLILDKINNILIVREKMLFVNKYIIKKQYPLSDISGVGIVTLNYYDTKANRSRTTYELKITCKDGNTILPFEGWSGSNHKKWQDMADKINNFNQSQETMLMISRKPFMFRLCFGVLFGFWYFLIGLVVLFPKEMVPIMYHILNVIFSNSGYHQ